MRKQHGFNRESKKNYIERLFLNVYAEGKGDDAGETKPDEKDTSTTEGATETKETPKFNYEDLISKARKEEKDKLYPKITALEKEKEDLIEKSNNSLLKIGELQTKIEEITNQSKKGAETESEEIINLRKNLADKETELAGLIETTEDISTVEERVREAVKEEYEVKLYREQKLREATEAGKGLIPELVTGGTIEDIDKSLEISQTRFNEIVNKTISGVKVPPANASTSNLNDKDFDIEDLANLDPRSEEYRELRKKLGLK